MEKVCMNCKWQTKGRPCPIFTRLHEPKKDLKIHALNRTNFGCNLFDKIGTKADGSVLNKLFTNEDQHCNYCRKITTTTIWDCDICGLSKGHPESMRNGNG